MKKDLVGDFENNKDIDELLKQDDNIKKDKKQERIKIIIIGIIFGLTSFYVTKNAYDLYKSSISIQKDLEDIYKKLYNMDNIVNNIEQGYTRKLKK